MKPVSPLPRIYNGRKDVHVKNEIVTGYNHLLKLSQGDMIEIKLHPPKHKTPVKNKPSARGAAILYYCAPRKYDELKSYLDKCNEMLDCSETKADFLTSIMSSEAIWLYLFNTTCDNDSCMENYILNILDFVLNLSNHLNNFPFRRKEIFSLILQKNLIGSLKDPIVRQSYEFRFVECAVTSDPALLKDVMPWVNRMMENVSNPFTKILYRILIKLADIVDLSNWKVLEEIPSIKEILGDPLERVDYLRPVSLKSGYKNGDDYLNVYYRLLRAECFSAVQKGIVDLRRGRLDPRDMDIYENVAVIDIDIDYTTVLLSLHFKPCRPVNDWSRSKKLMFGNLLCLSVKGDFSDPIWLTVTERDERTLQRHNVIGTELVSFHCSDINSAETIQKMLLHSGKMIMAESPTYFKSFQHVLTSLRNCQIEDLELYDEIVYGVYNKHPHGNVQLDNTNIKVLLKKINYHEMEEHQQVSFWHAVNNRLGIIQGPPGTGKTYVGAKLVHLFLELMHNGISDGIKFRKEYIPEEYLKFTLALRSEAEGNDRLRSILNSNLDDKSSYAQFNSPILVLTYKNHALDEFLKHCTEFCPKRCITRLGSQSKEECLKDCRLYEQLKNSRIRRTDTRGIILETECLFRDLCDNLKNLQQAKVLDFKSFIDCLSTNQILLFAKSALLVSWHHKPGKGWPKIQNNGILLREFNQWKASKSNDMLKMELMNHIIEMQNGSCNKNESQNVMIEKLITMKLQDAFINHWLPDKKRVQELARLQRKGAAFFKILPTVSGQAKHDLGAEMIETEIKDDLDQDYINEQLSMRRSAFDFDEDNEKRISSKEFKSKRQIRVSRRIKQNSSFSQRHAYSISDFPYYCQRDEGILQIQDIWNMSDVDKYTFIYSVLHIGLDENLEKMNSILEQIYIQQKKKELIDAENKLAFLKDQKIVGATIVGASVQLSLIQKLKPKIVIVEEAAEVLEPCLVAVLTKSVKKLVLIGDHKQLKPQVDTFYLRKEFNFHISMMERLISIGFPYEKLVKQGRMRPEFSCMLKDIYPEYSDFDGLAAKNKVINCLPCSMFFWSHDYDEVKDRSARNPGEANMVIALALFFVASGIPEEDITILCAYLGQVQLVKKLYGSVNPVSTPSGISNKKRICIKTIDEYQGDENNIVIISLTRSNENRNIGFLQEVERRCVAQSRAKCGLYFIGNADMFRQNKTWKFITAKMEAMNLISKKLPICCFRHPSYRREVMQKENLEKANANDTNELMYYVQTKDNWCKAICNVLFDCQIEEHRCKELCTPRHDDSKCMMDVSFIFPVCKHKTTKKCYVKDESMRCFVNLRNKLDCGHEKTAYCHNWLYEKDGIKCLEKCNKTYNCQANHACYKNCRDPHYHFKSDCTASVDFKYSGCDHYAPNYKTVCNKPQPPKKAKYCGFRLKYISSICGHQQVRLCRDNEKCESRCERQRPDCGHPCVNKCHEPCIGGMNSCEFCNIEYEKIIHAARIVANQKLDICKKDALDSELFALKVVPAESDEFSCLSEKCRTCFCLYSRAKITEIVKVQKVICPSNDVSFWTYARDAYGSLKEELLRLKEGFSDISSNEHLYSDLLSDTYESCYEFTKFVSRSFIGNLDKNSADLTIYISEVFLGERLNMIEFRDALKQDQENLDHKTENLTVVEWLRERKRNSILQNREQGPSSYFVFDGKQILPTYIVHLRCKRVEKSDDQLLKGFNDGEHKISNLDSFSLRDLNPLSEAVQRAIAIYKGDCSKRPPYKQRDLPMQIKAVGVVVNRECERKYQELKTECNESKKEFVEIYAYHATKPENIASIIKTNLDPNRYKTTKPAHGNRYGDGSYFSEHPQFSFNYGKETMLIFKLLLVEDRYTNVQPDEKGFCQQLVLQDASMFKPQFVLYFNS